MSRQRILIVDDDPIMLRMVAYKLEQADYQVLTAPSGRHALDMIASHGLPHLAIVDLTMPGMDGFDLCEALHLFSDLPIIILSAVDDEEAIVTGIERHAEDYITKPFSPRELLARVQRVLRRIGTFGYTLDPLVQIEERLAVDFGRQQAIVDGKSISLTPIETKLLYILMGRAGHTVGSEVLLSRLWPGAAVFEDSLRVHVRNLRKKIEPDPAQPRYILNERGVGYRFPAAG